MKKIKFWIVNEISTEAAEILMYGYIGEYEAIDDAIFLMDLRNLEARFKDITIRVNCGGGDVYKGMTIFNAIRQSKANIIIKIDGIAASMGAVFPLGAKKGNVSASKYARIMTHRVTGIGIGNADDLRTQADEMEVWEDNISDAISNRTGITKEEAKAKYIVNKDRWISAEQALAEGIIDSIYDADPVSVPEDKNPEHLFNMFQTVFLNKAKSQPKKYTMKKDLLKKLGLSDEATDAEIDTAVEKVLSDKETTENAVKAALKTKAKGLVDKAVQNKLITEAERAEYDKQAEESEAGYSFVEKIFNKMQPVKRPSEMLNRKDKKEDDDTTEVSDYEALVKKGTAAVAAFKAENFSEYKKMWEAHYKAPFPEHNA